MKGLETSVATPSQSTLTQLLNSQNIFPGELNSSASPSGDTPGATRTFCGSCRSRLPDTNLPSLNLADSPSHASRPTFTPQSTMPSITLQSLLIAGASLLTSVSAATIDTQLVGTWSTKSAKVLTGPVCSILGTVMAGVGSDGISRTKELIWDQ